jgi:hypothetical protein
LYFREGEEMNRKLSRKTAIILVVAVFLCLIGMIGGNRMQAYGGADFKTYTLTLSEIGDMIDKNIAENGKSVDITFDRDAYKTLGFSLIVPKNATAKTPAPVIIACPGDSSSKENEQTNYIELVRRGFVVLAMNYSGNMETDVAISDLTNGTSGMTAVVEYAMSLDYTDNSRVGIVAHSYGNGVACSTVNYLNQQTNNHVSAWVLEGTVDYAFPKSGWYDEKIMENPKDLYFAVICSKFDEWDNWYDDAVNFLTGDLAKEAVRNFYPNFSDDSIEEGAFYTAKGKVNYDPNSVQGESLNSDGGIVIWNPSINHNMTLTTTYGPSKVVTAFYAAFGVPEGSNYIDPNNEVSWAVYIFLTLGVIGFFMLFFPLIEILLSTKWFMSLRRDESKVAAEAPALTSWKEFVPLVVTTCVLISVTFYWFPRMWTFGYTTAFNDSYNRPLANAAGYYTMWCGILSIFMIGVNYLMRKIFHLKDGVTVSNPFNCLKLSGFGEFLKTVGFALAIVFLMYVPLFVAYYIFHVEFRMNWILQVMTFPVDEAQDYITFFVKYLPFWLVFYIPNAVINANTRYKGMPEWASTIWCVFMNAMGVLLYEVIQYHQVFTQGTFHWVGDNETWCGLLGVTMVPMISLAAFTARYAYKKTNSAWAGAIVNAIVMGLAMFVSSGAVSDLML